MRRTVEAVSIAAGRIGCAAGIAGVHQRHNTRDVGAIGEGPASRTSTSNDPRTARARPPELPERFLRSPIAARLSECVARFRGYRRDTRSGASGRSDRAWIEAG